LGESYVEFVLFENRNIPFPLSPLAEDVHFHEIRSLDNWWHVDPIAFECVTSKGLGLDCARVEFNVPMPPRQSRMRLMLLMRHP